MKLISIVTPCFNEEENVEELYLRIKAILKNWRVTIMSIFSLTTLLLTTLSKYCARYS